MLKEPTQAVWQALSHRPELDGFILIGGTALALHLHHRVSEDLDFAWPHPRLPRLVLKRLTSGDDSLRFTSNQDPWEQREADDAGFELEDFSQDYLVNEQVRVTFFCPELPEQRILSGNPETAFRIATIPEIFALKALVAARRSKTRDWFDLYILMKDHGFRWSDFYGAFVQAGAAGMYDFAAQRLCTAKPSLRDEGYESLLPNPPEVEEMRQFFLGLRNRYERGEEG